MKAKAIYVCVLLIGLVMFGAAMYFVGVQHGRDAEFTVWQKRFNQHATWHVEPPEPDAAEAAKAESEGRDE